MGGSGCTDSLAGKHLGDDNEDNIIIIITLLQSLTLSVRWQLCYAPELHVDTPGCVTLKTGHLGEREVTQNMDQLGSCLRRGNSD